MACLEAGDIGASERADDAAAAIAGSLGLPACVAHAVRRGPPADLAQRLDLGTAPGPIGPRDRRGGGEGATTYLHRGQLYLIWWTEGRLLEVGGASTR